MPKKGFLKYYIKKRKLSVEKKTNPKSSSNAGGRPKSGIYQSSPQSGKLYKAGLTWVSPSP